MPRHLRALFCALAIGFGLVSAQASAQTVVPVVKLATAPLVTPATAWGAYSTSTTHTNGAAAFTATPPEISALARSLGAERLSLGQITTDQFVANVYDYVRNNIETEFRFGLAKGGRGALIDDCALVSSAVSRQAARLASRPQWWSTPRPPANSWLTAASRRPSMAPTRASGSRVTSRPSLWPTSGSRRIPSSMTRRSSVTSSRLVSISPRPWAAARSRRQPAARRRQRRQ